MLTATKHREASIRRGEAQRYLPGFLLCVRLRYRDLSNTCIPFAWDFNVIGHQRGIPRIRLGDPESSLRGVFIHFANIEYSQGFLIEGPVRSVRDDEHRSRVFRRREMAGG